MARYSLNLPIQLKHQAEQCSKDQGVSLNQFILWAVSEKVGSLNNQLDDHRFPHITYRTGAAGQPTPVIRGTSVRVQSIVITHKTWGDAVADIADNYGLTAGQVQNALDFYAAHRQEIDANIAIEEELEEANDVVSV